MVKITTEVKTPDCIFGDISYDLSGVTMSEVTAERPDPLVELREDNMNSFMTVGFAYDVYQMDFMSSWRTYRAMHDITSAGTYKISMPNVYADSIEIYVDGKCVHTTDAPVYMGEVSCMVEFDEPKKIELRMLFNVKKAGLLGGGFREAIRIYKA